MRNRALAAVCRFALILTIAAFVFSACACRGAGDSAAPTETPAATTEGNGSTPNQDPTSVPNTDEPASPTEPVGEDASIENAALDCTDRTAVLYGGILCFIDSNENKQLNYLDIKTGESMVLCAKPECAHTDSSCSACLAGAGHLMAYGGRLFWTEHPLGEHSFRLCSMNLDSTDRRVEFELGWDIFTEYGDSGTADIFGGRLWLCLCADGVDQGSPINKTIVLSYDLKTGKRQEIYREESGRFCLARLYDGRLYLAFWYWGELEFCCMDLNSRTMKTVCRTEMPQYAAPPQELYLIGSKLVIRSASDCWCCDIETGEFASLHEWNGDREGSEAVLFCTDEKALLLTGMDEYRLETIGGDVLSEGKIKAEGFPLKLFEKETIGMTEGRVFFRFEPMEVGTGGAGNRFIVSFDLASFEWKTEWSAA